MPTLSSYDYAFVRVVPHADRGEFLNVGVILYCRTQHFLAAQVDLDEERILALDPGQDVAGLREHLELIPKICQGQGPIGELGQADSFHWLVAPHSTVVQFSPVHTGLCVDPQAELEHVMDTMVRVSAPRRHGTPSHEDPRGMSLP